MIFWLITCIGNSEGTFDHIKNKDSEMCTLASPQKGHISPETRQLRADNMTTNIQGTSVYCLFIFDL